MSDKTWLTVTDAAAHASVSRDTVYSAVERAELRHVRVGGRRTIRLRSEWVDEWLERSHGACASWRAADHSPAIRVGG